MILGLLIGFGAFMNRLRGGLLPWGEGWSLVVFCVLMLLTTGSRELAAVATIGMWVGESFRWGRYIGATGGWEEQELMGIAPIDFLIQRLKPYMRIWGFAGLTLRGAVWGGFVTLAYLVWALWAGQPLSWLMLGPVVGGLAMAVCYLLSIEFCRDYYSNPNRGWVVGEYVYGAVLWPLIFIYPIYGV